MTKERHANLYEMSTRGDCGSIAALKKLLPFIKEHGFVEMVGAVEKPRGGRPSSQYAMTGLGLMFLLVAIGKYGYEHFRFKHLNEKPETQVQISTLAQKYPEALPLIFGLWQRFEAHHVDDLAEKRLTTVASFYLDTESEFVRGSRQRIRDYVTYLQSEPMPMPTHIIHGGLTERMFFDVTITQPFDKQEKERWHKALRADAELRKPFIGQLSKKRAQGEILIQIADAYTKDLTNVQPLDEATAKEIARQVMFHMTDF
jgi:hypothetical protein